MTDTQAPSPTLNREQRRILRRIERGRTAPSRKPKQRILVNPVEYAIEGIRFTDRKKCDREMQNMDSAITAFRQGTGTYQQWRQFTSWINILCAINDNGVITGWMDKIAYAEKHLRELFVRYTHGSRTDSAPAIWHPTALYADEIEAMLLIRDMAKFTLNTINQREYEAAHKLATARVLTERGIVGAA